MLVLIQRLVASPRRAEKVRQREPPGQVAPLQSKTIGYLRLLLLIIWVAVPTIGALKSRSTGVMPQAREKEPAEDGHNGHASSPTPTHRESWFLLPVFPAGPG